MKLYEKLEQQLKKEPNFVTDNGELKKWVVLNKAQNFDEELIALLLQEPTLKEKFFKEIAGVTVFNQNLFVQFLEQKNYLNDSYTQYKNKVGLTIDGKYLKQRNEVALVWPFKDCILEGGQSREEDKREEIFFNEILAQDEITQLLEPKVLTNAKRIDKDGEKPLDQFNRDAERNRKRGLPEDTITDNLIIKGNNLLALHTLKEEFAGKVKLIYIDPPYNTGNDGFKYNDSFNHSTWLTFMKNRLIVAKELLRKDGVIFIQCDDNEQAYLKVLCDEVFKRKNFVKTLHIQMSNVQGEKVKAAKEGRIVKNGEYIHIYSNNGDNKIGLQPLYDLTSYDTHYSIFINEDNTESSLTDFCLGNEKIRKLLILSGIINDNGLKTKFTIKQIALAYEQLEAFRDFIHKFSSNIVRTDRMVSIDDIDISNLEKNKVYSYKHKNGKEYLYGIDSNGELKQRFRLSDKLKECDDYYSTVGLSTLRGDWWAGFHIDLGNINKESVVHLDNGQKPERLIENIIRFTTTENDILLDFHLGSGTTSAVAHKMKRQYIGVEQIENQIELIKKRIGNIIEGDNNNISKKYNWQGGGSFVYLELKKYNQTFIEQIEVAKDTETLLQIWEQMKAKSFLNYNVDIKKQEEHIEEFKTLTLKEQKQHLCEILDKNQLYVNLSSLNDADFACTEEEKRLNRDFYKMK
jgi:adenine-specific DNA-methyltransferase